MPSESFREYRAVDKTVPVLVQPDPISYEYRISSTGHRDVHQISIYYGYSNYKGFRLHIRWSVTEAIRYQPNDSGFYSKIETKGPIFHSDHWGMS